MAEDEPDQPPSRRAALQAGMGLAAAAAGAGFAGGAITGQRTSGAAEAGTRTSAHGPTGAPAGMLTFAQWAAQRGERYFIAHRGAGDVLPEHTIAAYDGAVQWGARCVEVSVRRTSDGVLICHHDATYDRTTTATGAVRNQPSSILRAVRVRAPQLGPAWSTPPLPEVARFEDVVRRFAGRAILCVDAKDDAAYPAMIDTIDRYGARASVIVKVDHQSANLEPAQRDGFPVFAYFGQPVPVPDITALARRLRRGRDYLGITPGPSTGDDSGVVRSAVGTGVDVWMAPVHRRSDAARYFGLGAKGIVTSSYGYVARNTALALQDAWRYKAITPGELTRSPADPAYAPEWAGEDELVLGSSQQQQFLTLGNLSPVPGAAGSYRVQFEARWTRLPSDPAAYLALAFAHADDRYYESRLGASDGFHGVLRASGSLELFSHSAGRDDGQRLHPPLTTPAVVTDKWMALELAVTPSRLTWARTDAPGRPTITVTAAGPRGGYLHIGRTGAGVLALRHLRVLPGGG